MNDTAMTDEGLFDSRLARTEVCPRCRGQGSVSIGYALHPSQDPIDGAPQGAIHAFVAGSFDVFYAAREAAELAALWRIEHAEAVRAWAQSIGLSILNTDGATSFPHPEVGETSSAHIQLPDIGDIAPGGVVAPCLADVERMLADQHLEPTALNWIALCDHFLSLPLISVGRAVAFRLLREAIERAALGTVRIDPPPASRRISQEAG